MSDTVTLALQGEVSLAEFSAAVTRFNALIAALAADSHVEDVTWQIDALDYSSATTTARGISMNGGHPDRIDRVVRSYLEVGQALEQGVTIPFSPPVQKEAVGIAGLLKDSTGMEAVRFETAESDAIIREPAPTMKEPTVPAQREGAYGSVTGRVQTLTNRNALRFTLFDHVHDRAVYCYLVEGGEPLMRQMWGRVATVEGWISRDPATGRPMSVRRVSEITPLTEVESSDYKKARGVIPRGEDDPLPEAQIRQLRDA